MRKRIPIGLIDNAIWALFIVLFFAVFTCPGAQAQVLPIAIGHHWSTAIAASSDAGGSLAFSDSELVAPAHLVANGTFYVSDLSGWVSHPGFFAIQQADAAVQAVSILTYDSGTSHAQFSVPQLERSLVHVGDVGSIDRIVNDGVTGTYLVLINESSNEGNIEIHVLDADNKPAGIEYLPLPPGLTFYQLQSHVDSGHLILFDGYQHFGPNADATIFGFAAIGPPSGASQRVEVLR